MSLPIPPVMSLQSILFEGSILPYLAIILIDCVLIQIWNSRRTTTTGRLAIAGLTALPLLFLLQWAVTTDAERLERICGDMADAVEQGDVRRITLHISDTFEINARGEVWDKSRLRERVEQGLMRWDVQESRVSRFDIQVDGDRATAEFQANCRLVTDEMMIPAHISRWKLGFVREAGIWRVARIEPRRTPFMPYGDLGDLLRR